MFYVKCIYYSKNWGFVVFATRGQQSTCLSCFMKSFNNTSWITILVSLGYILNSYPQVANAISRSLPSRPPEGSRNLLEVEITPAGRCVSQAAITAASIRRLRWKREGAHIKHTNIQTQENEPVVEPPSFVPKKRLFVCRSFLFSFYKCACILYHVSVVIVALLYPFRKTLLCYIFPLSALCLAWSLSLP